MPDIRKIKSEEMQEIIDFYNHIYDYGHIYKFGIEKLNEPFDKIMSGIAEIQHMMDDSWDM